MLQLRTNRAALIEGDSSFTPLAEHARQGIHVPPSIARAMSSVDNLRNFKPNLMGDLV